MLADLPLESDNPDLSRLYALMRDYPARGGKRLRGLLLLLSCSAHGGKTQDALACAAALELFQTWVLVHDDIEDDSLERRGQPTLHRQVGMPIALNVGDALHIYMWKTLLLGLPQNLDTKAIFANFEAMLSRTAEGQHLDLSWIAQNRFDVSPAEYLHMVTLKSAYYTVVGPLVLGARCAGQTPDPALCEAGKQLGVAFQIRDDVMNLLSNPEHGKEFAGDIYEAKRTLILAHFFEHAAEDVKAPTRDILSKPRAEKTPAEVRLVLRALQESGSVAYAQGQAESTAKSGLDLLASALQGAANPEAAQLILDLLSQVAARRH